MFALQGWKKVGGAGGPGRGGVSAGGVGAGGAGGRDSGGGGGGGRCVSLQHCCMVDFHTFKITQLEIWKILTTKRQQKGSIANATIVTLM